MSEAQNVSSRLSWHWGDHRERFPSHVQVTATRERQVGEVTQVIEKIMINPTDAYEHPGYRGLEIRGDDVRILFVVDTLKTARGALDALARRLS